MTSIIQKWTSMLTTASSGFLTLLAAAATVAIIIFVLIGVFSGQDQERAGTVKTLVVILVFCAVAACSTELVTWALQKG